MRRERNGHYNHFHKYIDRNIRKPLLLDKVSMTVACNPFLSLRQRKMMIQVVDVDTITEIHLKSGFHR